MARCRNGHENPAGAAFCSVCGAGLARDETPPAPPGAIPPPTPVGEPPPQRRSWFAAHKLATGLLVALLVLAIGTAAGLGDVERGAPGVSSPSASPTSSGSTEEPTPSPTESSPTESPEPEPPPLAKPKTYSGSGDRIIRIQKPSGDPSEPVIATLTHSGAGNFIVWTLNRNLREDQLLVNTIGSYQGTVVMDLEQGQTTSRLSIEGGSWKVVLKPLGRARSFQGSTKGRGDDVLIYRGVRGVANFTYAGRDNFIVWFYGESSSELLVNDIGNYRGQAVFGDGPALVSISGGSGTWTIRVK